MSRLPNRKTLSKLTRICLDLIDVPVSRAKHFSFIMDGPKIICMGYNNGWKTHPSGKKFGHRYNATHSELHAINCFPYPISELTHYDLINIRVRPPTSPEGILGLAAPCRQCRSLLSVFQPRRIYYSGNDQSFQELKVW